MFLFGPDDISNVRKMKKGNESWNQVFPYHQMRIGREKFKCFRALLFGSKTKRSPRSANVLCLSVILLNYSLRVSLDRPCVVDSFRH